jgi:tetratricopeptide (TPR) repeat protein
MLLRPWIALALALTAVGCAARQPPVSDAVAVLQSYEGPDRVRLDLLRTGKGGPRIFVQATIGDSAPLLFMVDTGADVNVLSTGAAEKLGLPVREGGFLLAGLSGRTTAGLAVAPELRLADATLRDVPFAVGVRGVSETAGFMPVAGILGMETWKRFVLRIDYPRDRLVLLRHGTGPRLRRGSHLGFTGASIEAAIDVTTATTPRLTERVIVQVDTGASALLLAGPTGVPFAAVATEGLEPIYGVGASEFLPPSQFLRTTRRIPIKRVRLGGATFKAEIQAQWIDFEHANDPSRLSTRGLIGHRLLSRHRVWIDPVRQRFALRRPVGLRRQLDGHRILLDQDIAAHGAEAPDRDLARSKYLIALDDLDAAVAGLERWNTNHPDDAEGRVLLARALRYRADLAGAWAAIRDLGPDGLVDEGEILAAVNGLILESRLDEAEALARSAVAMRPDEAASHLAFADALAARGDLDDANDALLAAARLRQNPDGFLLRRSRLALVQGDRDGAMARVRRLVREYPTDGKYLWYYALLLETDDEIATFRSDLAELVNRLHENLLPLDFLVASHQAIGDVDQARALMREGIGRDCEQFKERPGRNNCVAWYFALAGHDLDRARAMIDRALASAGPRSDFLDTKAVIHLARGELDDAFEAALAAARLSPDDIYMQWQVERISELARAAPAP